MARDDFDIERLKALDDGEWTRVVEAYNTRLYCYIRRQLGDDDLTEEFVQETFHGAIRGMSRFDARFNVEQYLVGIARNKLIDHFRKKKLEVQLPDGDDGDAWTSGIDAGAARASQIESTKELAARQRAVLVEALREMVADLKAAGDWKRLKTIELCFLKPWRHREIADRLGITDEKSIAGVKFRAIKDLQDRLRKKDPGRDLFAGLWRDA